VQPWSPPFLLHEESTVMDTTATDPDLLIAAINAAGWRFNASDRARVAAAATARAAGHPVELPADRIIAQALKQGLGYRHWMGGEDHAVHIREIIEDRNRPEGRGWDWTWDLCDLGLSAPEEFGWLNTPSIWGLWQQEAKPEVSSPFWQKVREALQIGLTAQAERLKNAKAAA
jgi:hypothetical protein